MAWTDEFKDKAKQMYLDAGPTPESSVEIIKDIAEELEQSANGVRQVLIQAGIYVKKDAATSGEKTKKAADGDAPKRVSKESQIVALRTAIIARGREVDEEILSKLTGKAAAYFTTVLN